MPTEPIADAPAIDRSSGRPAPAPLAAPPSGGRIWLTAIRPRTLSIAVTPVLLGTALAWADGSTHHWAALLAALACALLIQIGTNLHNDVLDFERGTDHAGRIGPLRVTAAGWVSARSMHRATALCFGLTVPPGLYLVGQGGWPILLAGLGSLLAGWAYSGGPRPVSHTALGELFVLVFFGLVAVVGSHWLQAGATTLAPWLGGAALGLPAAAVLLVNNYRDLDNDLRSGRRTLVARLGRAGARRAYAAMLLLPYALVLLLAWRAHPGALLALVGLPVSIRLTRRLRQELSAPELNELLAATAKAGSILGLLLAVGMLL
ncbi:MAG: 1,4-dihydroxy-2-naphthoate polyprenyltransferase [Leptothrix sp. (in: b-proteobacteria)]